MTLRKGIEKWLRVTANRRGKASAYNSRMHLDSLLAFMETHSPTITMRKITPEHIAAYIEQERQRICSNTLNMRFANAIRPLFVYAQDAGWLGRNPLRHVALPPAIAFQRPSLTKEQLARVVAAAQNRVLARPNLDQYHYELPSAIVVAYWTGLRFSDVCLLRRDAIDLDGRTMVISPHKRRNVGQRLEIPLAPELYEHLALWTRDYHPDADGSYGWWERLVDHVHPYLALRYEKTRGTLISGLRTIFDEAGLTRHSFHSLRHGFVTRLINVGVDPVTIGSITGQSIVTVKRYAHVSLEAKRAAMEKAA